MYGGNNSSSLRGLKRLFFMFDDFWSESHFSNKLSLFIQSFAYFDFISSPVDILNTEWCQKFFLSSTGYLSFFEDWFRRGRHFLSSQFFPLKILKDEWGYGNPHINYSNIEYFHSNIQWFILRIFHPQGSLRILRGKIESLRKCRPRRNQSSKNERYSVEVFKLWRHSKSCEDLHWGYRNPLSLWIEDFRDRIMMD